MNRCAWSGTLLPGKRAEYERRHREQSAAFRKIINEAGIYNYSIWCNGDRIFAYMETDGHFEDARQALNRSPEFRQWKEDMKDLIRIDTCPKTGDPVWLEEVYYTQFGHNFSIFVSEAVSHGLIDGLQYVCGDLKVE